MKVLAIAGCSHRAYMNYLTDVHPDWDNRAVVLMMADKWIAEKNPKFLDFIEQLDIFIGLTDREPTKSAVNPAARSIFLPSFDFRGYQPDTIWLLGVPSPMDVGVIHSRIAASAFLHGKTIEQTLALFNDAHYQKLGYYEVMETDKRRILDRFTAAGLDISNLFETWAQNGNFLHIPVHPDVRVFFDLIHLGLKNAGLADDISPSVLAAARAGMHDYLAEGCLWPVYPEIAAHFKIVATPSRWRTSAAKGTGVEFDLEEMLRRSWAIYEAMPEMHDSMTKALGGAEQIALYANI